MGDIITIDRDEKDSTKQNFAIQQLAERFQSTEDVAAGALQAANNLDDLADLDTALTNLGINVTVTEVGDADYTILPTDWIIVTTTALSTTRTWTLPAASAVDPRHPILIYDRAGAVTSTNAIKILRAGSDTFGNGRTQFFIVTTETGARLYSNGVATFTLELINVGPSSLLDRLTITRGSLLYRGASAWSGLAPNTAGYVLTDGGSGADPAWAAPVNNSAVLQVLQTTYATNANLTVQIPGDDTTPGSSEGTEVLSQAITPSDNTNKVLAEVSVWGAVDTNNTAIAVSLFRGTTCIDARQHTFPTSNFPAEVTMKFLDSPAAASAQTYSVRVGPTTAVIARLNGVTTTRLFGGTATCTLTVSEIAA